jgi:hypothetical protein
MVDNFKRRLGIVLMSVKISKKDFWGRHLETNRVPLGRGCTTLKLFTNVVFIDIDPPATIPPAFVELVAMMDPTQVDQLRSIVERTRGLLFLKHATGEALACDYRQLVEAVKS